MAGCDSSVRQLGEVADSTRNATEHVVISIDAANDAKEAKIYAAAQGMNERERAPMIQENGGRPRYELHQDGVGDSWAVYDTVNNRVVRIGAKSQASLSHSDAEAVFLSLQQDNQDRNALGPGYERPGHSK
jgi:hypothetical protein